MIKLNNIYRKRGVNEFNSSFILPQSKFLNTFLRGGGANTDEQAQMSLFFRSQISNL